MRGINITEAWKAADIHDRSSIIIIISQFIHVIEYNHSSLSENKDGGQMNKLMHGLMSVPLSVIKHVKWHSHILPHQHSMPKTGDGAKPGIRHIKIFNLTAA